MARDTIDLIFPVGGLSRRFDYQRQEPYTTPNALNVRAKDTVDGRVRGGARPGLAKAFAQQTGGGNPVRLLNTVREITPTQGSFLTDEFVAGDSVTDNGIWTAASWKSGAPRVENGYAYAGNIGFSDVGVVLNAPSPSVDTAKAYSIQLQLLQLTGPGGTTPRAEIFLRMDNTTPNQPLNGVLVRAEMLQAASRVAVIKIEVYSAGVMVETYQASGASTGTALESLPSILKVLVNETDAAPNRIHVTWEWGVYSASLDQTITTAAAGSRIGFGLVADENSGAVRADSFTLNYTQTGSAGIFNRNRVVVGANQAIYEENNAGELVAQSPTFYTAPTRVLSSVERLGKLYVADPTFRYKCAVGCRLIDPDPADEEFGSLMVYDPANGTYTEVVATPGLGTVPTQCRLVALYKDRIVLANQSTVLGGDNAPHMVYFSRQGDELDWDFSETDVGAAWATVTTEQSGRLPAPCTALIAFTDDYMVFGSHSAIFAMRGDPRLDGTFGVLSHTLGIVDSHAWCRDSSNRVIFLSHQGLGAIVSGTSGYAGGIGVDVLSKAPLPRELRNIDVVNNTVLMAYDPDAVGVHIFITPNTAGMGMGHWFYDIESDAFWPVGLPPTMEPTALCYYNADESTRSGVLLGCRDGYVRRLSELAFTDDGTTIDAFCDYGPIMLNGDALGSGATRELVGVLDEQSQNATWSVRTGKTAEEAFAATARSDNTGTLTAGRGYTHRPRAQGRAAFVRISGGGGWAVEQLALTRESKGRERN